MHLKLSLNFSLMDQVTWAYIRIINNSHQHGEQHLTLKYWKGY